MTISDNSVHLGDFILDGMFATILGAPVIFVGTYILLQVTAIAFAHAGRLSRAIQVRQVFLRQTIIAYYEPPLGVHPAEMAFLYDQTFGKEEYLATLFDLERRGYIAIIPTTDTDDFVVSLKPTFYKERLGNIDLHVLATLAITKRGQHIYWRDASRRIALHDRSLQHVVETELVRRGWITERYRDKEYGIMTLFFIIAIFGVSAACLIPLGYIDWVYASAAIVSFIFWWPTTRSTYFRALRMAPRFNRHFTRVWGQLEGYRLFVEKVELDRIRFANHVAHEKYRHDTLPYAVALNLATDWQRRFIEKA